MPAFRRVEGRQAGPTALGILVPPGARTLVILRPRALEWDLLPLQDRDEGFCEFDRETAAGIARGIQQALEELQTGLEIHQTGAGFHVGLFVMDYWWIACPRQPGRAYRPLVFTSREKAQNAVNLLTPILC